MRRNIVAGNWKMNMTLAKGEELVEEISKKINTDLNSEVVICSPFIHLGNLNKIITGSRIKIGAQNCSSEQSGAFTGETSANMISSTGAEYVIIGHSERRSYFNESDELLAKKVTQALNVGLKVIYCCGEVLKDREAGNHFKLVKDQLNNGIFGLSEELMSEIIIAYEPIWAIGTGVTASSDQAQEMHNYIRNLLEEKYGLTIAENTSILYGGSCNAKNAKELFSMIDVDGGLIGGASLKADDFVSIINSF